MPKNTKSKKNSAKRMVQEKRELLLKDSVEAEQKQQVEYGQVVKVHGECNFSVRCSDQIERMCHLRKSVKRSYVTMDAIVLVGTRDFQSAKGDIIYLYTYEEAQKLKNMKEIDFNLSSGVTHPTSDDENEDEDEKDDAPFDFAEI